MHLQKNLGSIKRIKFFIFGLLFMILVFSPKSVEASFCIKPANRYILVCESDNCHKGFKVEYKYTGLIWCSSRPKIDNLNDDEIEIINEWRNAYSQIELDGVIEIEVYDPCDFSNAACSKEILSSVHQKDMRYDELEREIQNDVRREIIHFYISEVLYLSSRFLPIVLGVLLPILLSKYRKKFWLRFGLVLGIQVAWTLFIGSTIICCGDILSEFFFFITWIIIFIETIIIYIIRPKENTK